MIIRSLNKNDWHTVAKIYKEGIDTGLATFEKKIPLWKDWNKSHIKSCRIIAENEKEIIGWGALTLVSNRCIYAGVAEVSVYVAQNQRGKGVGYTLLKELIKLSEAEGIWSLQSGIFTENKASIELHKKAGFRVIGFKEKIGKLNGIWKDNSIMERRSKIVGID